MFIRNESFKDFLRFYPVISTLVTIHILLWITTEVIPLSFFMELKQLGVGHNGLIKSGEYWRIVTAMFFHFGLMHTLFNSFTLVLFGPALETMLGKMKFILFYLLTGVGGNVATLYLAHDFVIHAGASGAIYGIFGIYVYMMMYKKHLMDDQSSQIVKVILILGLIMTFLRTNINIYAHIFGLLTGFALGPLFLHNVRPFFTGTLKRYAVDDNEIHFDPDRWRKKRIPWKKIVLVLFWGAILTLVILEMFVR